MRKLSTVRLVESLRPIMGADRIEVARIDGWDVIVKKGEFEAGSYCVFFEIDSLLPLDDERFQFLSSSKQNKTVDGKDYFRLKTMKMRKTISQGLALPFASFSDDFHVASAAQLGEAGDLDEEISLDEQLGILKYEEPDSGGGSNSHGANNSRTSNFPSFIRKTDQDRVQNVFKNRSHFGDNLFVPTLKMDGSSTTMFYTEDASLIPTFQETYQHGEDYDAELEVVEYKPDSYFYLCSRNMWLKDKKDTLWHQAVARQGLEDKCIRIYQETGRSLALQGELVAPTIQKGHEGVEEPTIFVYSIFDVATGDYLPYEDVLEILTEYDVLRVPVLGDPIILNEVFKTVDDYVDYADAIQPIYAAVPEGVVFHSLNGSYSFKSISPKYLLKKG